MRRDQLMEDTTATLTCPSCGEPIWDGPRGSKLAKCWNFHPETGGTLAFDTMSDEDEEDEDSA